MLRLLSVTPGKLTELKEVKFRVENVYRCVFLSSLVSSLMETVFPCTTCIARAILMPHLIMLRVRTLGALCIINVYTVYYTSMNSHHLSVFHPDILARGGKIEF